MIWPLQTHVLMLHKGQVEIVALVMGSVLDIGNALLCGQSRIFCPHSPQVIGVHVNLYKTARLPPLPHSSSPSMIVFHMFDFGRGSALYPAGGANSAPPP